ncbi:MAG: GGDEF domain-containing protein [Proteobacteria bacterium]|nr:GGDEF domain-containing protein [Pseudomonadota bacterium]
MNHTKNNDSVTELSVLVQSDKLQLLYHQSFPAIFVSMFNAALLTAILWPVQDHDVLLGWLGFLFVTAIARLLLFIRYRKAAPQAQDVLTWEKPYFITLTLSSLTWGVGCLLIMPLDSFVHQAVIFYFLIGMSGGAISVYSAHRMMTLVTVAAVLLPATIYFLISGEFLFVGMAVGAVIFFISTIRATKVLGFAMHQNFLMTHQLEISNENAERLARIDELTGLFNRRAFYEHGKVLSNNCQRNKDELAMILMDIDNFKMINDKYGHAAGDTVLREIGKILLQRLRKSDVFARIGGEEFGMLLPLTTVNKAMQLAEELRQVIEATTITFEEKKFAVTASFGVTSDVSDIDTLVRQADMAMYRSKESGRNAVMQGQ